MQDTTTRRWPVATRRTCDRVQPKTRARILSKPVLAALFLCLGVVPNVQGQEPVPDPVVVGFQSYSSISGTVRDSRGAALTGIEVRVVGQKTDTEFKLPTDSDGSFNFTDLPAGIYEVKISVAGFQPFASEPLEAAAGAKHELQIVVTRLPTKTTTIDVNASLKEVAEA